MISQMLGTIDMGYQYAGASTCQNRKEYHISVISMGYWIIIV